MKIDCDEIRAAILEWLATDGKEYAAQLEQTPAPYHWVGVVEAVV